MIRYMITMGIRMACFLVAILIPLSWWTLIPLAGALFLPYIAVVAANTVVNVATPVQRPGSLIRSGDRRDPGSDE